MRNVAMIKTIKVNPVTPEMIDALDPQDRAEYDRMRSRYIQLTEQEIRTDEDRVEMHELYEAARRLFDKSESLKQ